MNIFDAQDHGLTLFDITDNLSVFMYRRTESWCKLTPDFDMRDVLGKTSIDAISDELYRLLRARINHNFYMCVTSSDLYGESDYGIFYFEIKATMRQNGIYLGYCKICMNAHSIEAAHVIMEAFGCDIEHPA